MLNKKGFTLIELLVVIAIITILASIVTPRVVTYIARAKMAKAVSEVHNADMALQKLLADVERKSFGHVWQFQNFDPRFMTMTQAVNVYTMMFYELLRKGKSADFTGILPDSTSAIVFRPGVQQKLAANYMDLGKDPWGVAYQFYAGPLTGSVNMYPFRAYRGTGTEGEAPYVYDMTAYANANAEIRGNPNPTNAAGPYGYAYGYPCPKDLPVYIYSRGEDNTPNQWFPKQDEPNPPGSILGDGGDDVNNWDFESGWGAFY